MGEPLSSALRDDALAAFRAHGLDLGGGVVALAGWRDVLAVLRRDERECAWWDFEEEERERVWETACERFTEEEIVARVELEVARERRAIDAGLAAACACLAIVDPAWVDAARSAALMSVHQHALVGLAGAPDAHLFAFKRRVFAAGHWPLGGFDDRYVVY